MNEAKRIIEVSPASPGRRVLAYLADIFLNVILAILLFEMVVFQVGKVAINYQQIMKDDLVKEQTRYQILYDNNLLRYDDKESEEYDIGVNLATTFNDFLKFYIFEETSDQYEVFYHYFITIKEEASFKVADLNKFYYELAPTYFEEKTYNRLGTLDLKEEMKISFKANFIEGDEMSEDAKIMYSDFQRTFFLNMYQKILLNAKETDLVSPLSGASYLKLTLELNILRGSLNNTYIICAFISFFLSNLILFLFVPLFTKKGRTFSEKILKLERVNKETLNHLSKPLKINIFLLKMVDSLALLFLVPILSTGLSFLFKIPLLYLPSLIGIGIGIINLILIFARQYNDGLLEITTDSVILDEKSLDEFYEELNYGK